MPSLSSPSQAPINTSKIRNRRTLAFKTIDEATTEADRLTTAERTGNLRQLGNWTFGQTLGHLAAWAGYSFDGAPMKLPFIVKLVMRPMKRKIIWGRMHAGAKIPRIKNGTLATEVIPTEDGIARFHKTFARLKQEAPTQPNFFFGPLTHEEWINLNLRHAELHFSFYEVR
jgi:hypothetical protein